MSMKTILAYHYDQTDWVSRVIAFFSHDTVSHVALVSPDGYWVIEASGLAKPSGVRVRRMVDWADKHPGYELRWANGDPEKVWAKALTQEGKGYDWWWWWGWITGNPKAQDPEKLTCAELIAWAFREAGFPLFFIDNLWHVKPSDLRAVTQLVNKE
jgi:hypothetical protein